MTLPTIDIYLEFKNLYSKGYVPSLRKDNTGIGFTLETMLGIPENNAGEPDLQYKNKKIELKSHRENTNTRITLITKVPYWTPYTSKEIIENFGYIDKKERKALKVIITYPEFNAQDLKLEIKNNNLYIIHKSKGELCYYTIDELMENINKKLYQNLLLVFAKVKKTDGKEFFLYNKAILLSNLKKDKFIDMIKSGEIIFEFRMHLKKDNVVRDHGPGFRVQETFVADLYSDKETIIDYS